jgi:predicted porin
VKKKLMVVAVAGALAAPALALAQTSTVNIYGNIEIDVVKLDQGSNGNLGATTGDPNDPSTAPGRPARENTRVKRLDLMSRYNSYLGFRGEEKLGGGMSAWFQCESTMDITGEDAVTGGGPTGLCDRNSGVGIKGAWGNVFIGNWDSPHKINHGGKYRPFSSATVFGMRSLLFNENGDWEEGAPRQFDNRVINSVNWHSPSWGGFNVKGQFTTQDASTDSVPGQVNGGVGVTLAGAAGPFKPRLWSLGAEYDNGPLSIAVGYEAHKDYNAGGVITGFTPGLYSGGTDRAWEIAAGYTFAGVFRLSGIYSQLRYDVANGQDMKHRGWVIYGDWRIAGPHRLRMEYANARDVKGTSTASIGSLNAPMGSGGVPISDTGADLWGIQYAYSFSKRTEMNVGYARLDNDRNSRHRLQSSAARPGGPDRDQDAFQVGIKHRF